jgi:hypothetical protein
MANARPKHLIIFPGDDCNNLHLMPPKLNLIASSLEN